MLVVFVLQLINGYKLICLYLLYLHHLLILTTTTWLKSLSLLYPLFVTEFGIESIICFVQK